MKQRCLSKRLLAIIAALALTLSAAATTVFAQSGSSEPIVVKEEQGENWCAVTYAYEVAE